MTKIRISGVTDLSAARAVAALPIDFVALNITPSDKDFVSPIKVPDYLQWLSGVEVVLQAHHLNGEQAQKIAGLLNVQHIELLAEQVVVPETAVKLWAYEKGAPSTCESFAVVTPSDEALTQNKFFQIRNALNLPTESSSYDINVEHFTDAEGLDVRALEQLVTQLRTQQSPT